MQTLDELQIDFGKRLLNLESPAPERVFAPSDAYNNERFLIYRNNVVASLIEALGDNFPVVKALVGNDFFSAVAKLWVLENPPEVPMLFLYGEGFSDFLSSFEPAQSVPYLADIARLEQARRLSYHAADASSVCLNDLQEIPEPRLFDLTLILHPSLRVVDSLYPLQTVWLAATAPDAAEDKKISHHKAEHVLVVRTDLEVNHHILNAPTSRFITALVNEASLGEAASSVQSDTDFNLASALSLLFQSGGVSDLKLAG